MQKPLLGSVVVLLASFFFSSTALASNDITYFRDGKSGAVSLTFDDGYASQMITAFPPLDARSLKGTLFSINSWIGHQLSWDNLRDLASRGHEIGSHTVNHLDLTTLSETDMRFELSESQRLINLNVPSQSCVTLGYPYGSSVNDQVRSVARDYYIAGRDSWAIEGGYLNHYEAGSDAYSSWKAVNFMNVGSLAVSEGETAITDIDIYLNLAVQRHAWYSMHFHEIKDVGFFNQVLDHVTAQDVWVDTFGSIARYMRERQSSSLILLSQNSNEIKLTLTNSLDNSIYNAPLTIRSTIPSYWSKVKIQWGNSTTIVGSVAEGADNVVYYDVLPNNGVIILSPWESGPPKSIVMELKLEEGTGKTAFDSSDYNNNGSINGAVYTTDSAIGAYALSFDGDNDYLTCKSSGVLKPPDLSVALWVKHMKDTTAPNYGGIMTGAYGDGYSSGFRILDYNNGPLAQMNFGDAGPISIVGNPLTQGKWYHIVLTYDHQKIRLYQNGGFVREIAETRDINWGSGSLDLYLGWAQWYFKGLIDKATMYNYALNPQEIQQLYEQKPKLVSIANNQNINSIDNSEYIVKKNMDTGSLNYLPYTYKYSTNPDGWANPNGMAFMGNRLFISAFVPGTGNPGGIWEIDPNTGSEIAYLPTTWGQPAGLASDGTNLFVCQYYGSSNKIYRYGTSGQLISSFSVPVVMNGLAYGGGYLFGSNKNTIYRIDPKDGAIISTFTVPLNNVLGIGFVKGDSSYLVATAYLNSNIYRFNLDADLNYTGISSIITFVRGGYAHGVTFR